MRKLNIIVLLSMTLYFVGCGDLSKPSNEEVIGGKVLVDIDGNTIKKSLIAKKTPRIDMNTTVYGYKAYKIPYSTTDEKGNTVAASGLMVVPKGLPDTLIAAKGLSVVSDNHGTIFSNEDAPSVVAGTNNAPEGSSVILTSIFGFVTLQPDYVGFGDSSEIYHPFILKSHLLMQQLILLTQQKNLQLIIRYILTNNFFLQDTVRVVMQQWLLYKKLNKREICKWNWLHQWQDPML